MKNELNKIKEEVKILRGYIENVVDILEVSFEHISNISNACNCLREDIEKVVTLDEEITKDE